MSEDKQPLPYSVKLEQTARGIRISVHVYNKDLTSAAVEAVALLKRTEQEARTKGYHIAPVEI